MKKVYNIPNTTTVTFRAGMICAGSPAADPGTTVGGNALGGGEEATIPMDPM